MKVLWWPCSDAPATLDEDVPVDLNDYALATPGVGALAIPIHDALVTPSVVAIPGDDFPAVASSGAAPIPRDDAIFLAISTSSEIGQKSSSYCCKDTTTPPFLRWELPSLRMVATTRFFDTEEDKKGSLGAPGLKLSS